MHDTKKINIFHGSGLFSKSSTHYSEVSSSKPQKGGKSHRVNIKKKSKAKKIQSPRVRSKDTLF
jgi:hypothetical protein